MSRSIGSPSKRFTTTSTAAQSGHSFNGIDMPGEEGDRIGHRIVKDKTRGQKGSISFGNEKFEYISDIKDQQRKVGTSLTKEERLDMKTRCKDMKTALTATTFKLGDDIRYEYVSQNHLAMKDIEKVRGGEKAALAEDVKSLVKKSSLHFGNEQIKWASVASEGYKYHGNTNNFEKMRDEVIALKTNLRKHNFSFGEERVDYESDYQRGFKTIPAEEYNSRSRDELKTTIENIRKTHYSLGDDSGVDYTSATHKSMRTVEGHPPEDTAKYAQQAKELRQQLQRTTFTIGDDPEYM